MGTRAFIMKRSNPKTVKIPRYNKIPRDIKHSVLASIFQDLHSAPDLRNLLENINRLIKEEIHCQATLISIYDPYREELVYHSLESESLATEFKLKLGQGLAGKIAASQRPSYIRDLTDFPLSKVIYESCGIPYQQILGCPLIRRGALLGVIEVFLANHPEASADDDLAYLTVLSHQFAISLNYFKQSEQLERKSLEEENLAQVSQRISSSLDPDELLDIIINALRSLIPHDAAGIYLLERNSQEIQRMVVYGYPLDINQDRLLEVGRGARQLVGETRAAVILQDLSQFPLYVDARNSARSAMVTPILSNNRMIGVFTLESDQADVYTSDDLALFKKFSHQAALSIEKAQLHRALIEKNRLEQELSIAREIQMTFLPRREPPLAGFDVAGLNLPSSRGGRPVGGCHWRCVRQRHSRFFDHGQFPRQPPGRDPQQLCDQYHHVKSESAALGKH
ncbi:MAG: hypothetical protein DMG06_16140 [Acidobacteria bacterium]|nr:MAG: hypothetical protein DMG06_16140 [Acidobacteriota bacterium]